MHWLQVSVLTVLFLGGVVAAPVSDTCPVSADEFDQCVRTTFPFGDRNTFVPRSMDDMDKYCRAQEEALECMNSYVGCVKGLMKYSFKVKYIFTKAEIKRRCDDDKREEFVKAWSCVHQTSADSAYALYDYIMAISDYVASEVPIDKINSYACCIHETNLHLGMTEMTNLCSKEAAEHLLTGYTSLVAQYRGNVCEDYDYDGCLKNAPDLMAKFASMRTNVVPSKVNVVTLTRKIIERMTSD